MSTICINFLGGQDFNYPSIHPGCLTDSDMEALENYVLPYIIRGGGQLQETGANEMCVAREYWQQEMLGLSKEKYSEDRYKVSVFIEIFHFLYKFKLSTV